MPKNKKKQQTSSSSSEEGSTKQSEAVQEVEESEAGSKQHSASSDGKKSVTLKNCKAGESVERGKDWNEEWTQDHENGVPGVGVIVECRLFDMALAKVKWNNGGQNIYRVGEENSFDLFYSGNDK